MNNKAPDAKTMNGVLAHCTTAHRNACVQPIALLEMKRLCLRFGRLAVLPPLTLFSLLSVGCAPKGPSTPPKAMPVTVVNAQVRDVSVDGEWVGTLDGNVNAQIAPQVSGYLVRQLYREGSVVQKGQILFQIDPRPFEALVEQAAGQVGQAVGSLGQAEADLALAKINVKRDSPLADEHAIAQSQLDAEVQKSAQEESTVQLAQSSVLAARANLASAKLNLGFTEVRSLISGIAGQATTQVGNLVNQQSVLTSVSQMDPIKVFFSISDREYLALIRRARNGENDLLKTASAVPLTLRLADGSAHPLKGQIVYVDRQMNQQTGAIRVAALFSNPGNMLRPGQFGRVSANTEVQKDVIVVPQVAIIDLQGQKQVYVVGKDNKVRLVNVTVGPVVGSDVVVLAGLEPSSRVVTDNLQKLTEGVAVLPQQDPNNTSLSANSPKSGGL
jgi:membrane fusion protein (multidrug efflux system)